jgi:hypothetical protein
MRALMPQTRGGLPRAELAAETGICKPADGQSARRLAEAGLMADTGQRTAEGSGAGRAARSPLRRAVLGPRS